MIKNLINDLGTDRTHLLVKDIVTQHKYEKEEFFKGNYLDRTQLKKLSQLIDNKLIKVITGPRRVGKSTIVFLALKDIDFAYLNFDDENILKLENYDEIIKGLSEIYPGNKTIFFDEIQNLNNWELFVNKLQRRGYNLILTGSNAHLLSKELASSLTGRHISLEIFPFSFKEYLYARKININMERIEALPDIKGSILSVLSEYLRKGGLPEIITTKIDEKLYIETLFDSILFKDIVKRYNLKSSQKLYDLSIYLAANFTGEFTFTRLKNILDFKSVNTVQNYLGYLEETYLFFSLNRFSYKIAEQIKTARKIYCIDSGFICAKAFRFSNDNGKFMENTVFIELARRGYEPNKNIFYYKTKTNKEVDFVLKEGIEITQLIQVSFSLQNRETNKRELKALVEAGKELNCDNFLIITWDAESEFIFQKQKIKTIPLWKWLLTD